MEITKSSAGKSSLPLSSVFGYAMGEFGFTFFLIYIAYYLIFFLTDILEFDITTAAIIYSVCQWIEAITVVISGIMIDKSRASYRSWMLRGAVVCWAFTSILFTKWPVPSSVYAYIFILAYLVAYWGYNVMWISYRSLLGSIGRTPYDAVVLSTTGALLGTIASMIFSYLGIKTLMSRARDPYVYGMVAFVLCSVMLACIAVAAIVTKRSDRRPASDSSGRPDELTPGRFISTFKGSMLPLLSSIALRSSVPVITSTLMIYYLRHVIVDTTIMPAYVASVSAAAFLGAFVAKKAARYIDKRFLYLATGAMNILLLASVGIWGVSAPAFLIFMSANSFFMYVGNVLTPAFINDVGEYSLRSTGVDIRALAFSMGRLSLNASQILGSTIASFGLVLIGYNAKNQPDASVIRGIQNLTTFIPALMILAGVGVFLFYRLDDKTMENLRERKDAAR